MKLNNLKNKKIAILGLGIENISLLNFLFKKKIACQIIIFDSRNKKDLGDRYVFFSSQKNVRFCLENKNLNLLKEVDIIFRSPGWPLFCPNIKAALGQGVLLSSPMKLFFFLCPTANIIGVSGSKGKGTTSSLLYHILKTAAKKVYLGGNIGIAPFDFLAKLKNDDWVILELSSFQLEDMTISPKIAVITNFTQDHLAPADPNNQNYHRNMNVYRLAKLNLLKWQKENDYKIINQSLPPKNWNQDKGKLIQFSKSDLPSSLLGEHNRENIAAAVAVAKILKIKDAIIKQAVKEFKGLENRLEFVREKNQVLYYNDSFATIPESTIIALKSFSAPIILLAGGSEKNSNFKALAKEIVKRVKFVILIDGQATKRLKEEIIQAKFDPTKIFLAQNMSEAVKKACKQGKKNDIVLLSPACASFGIFKNYKERAQIFKNEVNNL